MLLTKTKLGGLVVVDIDRLSDDRGFFARTWCHDTFAAHGLDAELSQCSISFNIRRGTLRGMHYQAEPHAESKLVRVTRGAIFDVVVDVRPASPTFGQWFGIELTADNRRGLFIPKGFAHGFETLADDSEVFYQISTAYVPEAARGIRFDDPAIGIDWPLPVSVVAERDRNLPVLSR